MHPGQKLPHLGHGALHLGRHKCRCASRIERTVQRIYHAAIEATWNAAG